MAISKADQAGGRAGGQGAAKSRHKRLPPLSAFFGIIGGGVAAAAAAGAFGDYEPLVMLGDRRGNLRRPRRRDDRLPALAHLAVGVGRGGARAVLCGRHRARPAPHHGQPHRFALAGTRPARDPRLPALRSGGCSASRWAASAAPCCRASSSTASSPRSRWPRSLGSSSSRRCCSATACRCRSRLCSIAYPSLSIFMVVVTMRIVFDPSREPRRPSGACWSACRACSSGDVVYMFAELNLLHMPERLLDLPYALAYLGAGTGALHVSMRKLTDLGEQRRRRAVPPAHRRRRRGPADPRPADPRRPRDHDGRPRRALCS